MIKRLRELTFSGKYTLEERRFLLTGLVSFIALLSVLASVIFTGQSKFFAVAIVVAILLLGSVIRYSLRYRSLNLGGSIIILISNLLIIPAGYFLRGGIDSGVPIWFVLGLVLVFVMFRGTLFWIYFIMTMASFIGTVYLSVIHPDWVVPLKEQYSIYSDVLLAMALVSIICGMLYQFQSQALEHELENAEGQRGEIEKLNDMQSNFFASMSHEIRTPISTIIGLNEMTMREKNLPEEVLENTLNIQNASKILLSLINDLLDMSKIQSDKMDIIPAEYDTSAMLSEITNLHWNKAIDKGLHFDVQVSEEMPQFLYGDETRIKQVIINLINNAIKYTEEGYVVVRFGGEVTAPDRFLLCVEIEDTGIGIRKENIPYLFDAFRREEEGEAKNIEGTGLGLSIAKQLVELMDGVITVNSIYTKGSTFRVEIPQGIVNNSVTMAEKPGIIKAEKKEYQHLFEAPEAKVLIVDDNDMNRIVCQKLLRATGVQVDLAASGRECLEKTKMNRYDAILMDHEMPQMDGIETLHRLRQQSEGMCRDTTVIALTANAGSDREAFYVEQGFSAYLSKPIQSRQLENLLLACLPEELIEKNYVKESAEETFTVFETVHKIPYMVTTDSICDLPDYILKEYEIRVMPYYIETEKGRFRDMREIDADNLQKLLDSGNHEIHSDPAGIEEYEEFFGEALTEARYVIHFSACRKVSQAYVNASMAAKSFGNVIVIDSGHISSGLGMVAVRASDLLRKGIRLDEVMDDIERYKSKVRLNYLVPSLLNSNTKYRTAFIAKALMKLLNMEAVFTTKNGKLKIRRFLMGYTHGTAEQFIRTSLAHKGVIDTSRVYVTFSGCSAEKRSYVLDEIEKYVQFEDVIVNKSSAATFSNCGPNAFGITYEILER